MRALCLASAMLLAVLPAANASVLYKSVLPNGTVMFSDVPPPEDATLVERREIAPPAADVEAGLPVVAEPQAADYDAAIARANARVDLAEHALAAARRDLWSPRDGLGLEPSRMSPADEERVRHYQLDVRAARAHLMELLRERQQLALR